MRRVAVEQRGLRPHKTLARPINGRLSDGRRMTDAQYRELNPGWCPGSAGPAAPDEQPGVDVQRVTLDVIASLVADWRAHKMSAAWAMEVIEGTLRLGHKVAEARA